jgi:hypothetical protein
MALQYLARSAGAVEPTYNRLWSEELFFYALQLPRNWNRLAFQKNALEALASSDPVRSMQLFGTMEDPIPLDSGRFPEDVRAFAARIVFPAYWKQTGVEGFDEIRSKAQFLGNTGQYPYAAIASIERDLAHSEDLRAQVLFRDAVSYFSRGSHFDNAGKEYVELLNAVWDILSAPLKHQAITAAVTKLTQPPPSGDFDYRGTVRNKTSVIQFSDQHQQLLFELMPRIREVDPQTAERLMQKNPSFAAAEDSQSGESGIITNVSSASPRQLATSQVRLTQFQTLARITNEVDSDPEMAVLDARSLTIPELKVRAFAQIAASLATKDPARASELLGHANESDKTLKNESTEDTVLALFARAKANYALHDRGGTRTAWTNGFELAEELFRQDLETHPNLQAYEASCFDTLMDGVKFGAEIDPAMALGALRSVRNQLLQTYLPIAAAEGISSHDKSRH